MLQEVINDYLLQYSSLNYQERQGRYQIQNKRKYEAFEQAF